MELGAIIGLLVWLVIGMGTVWGIWKAITYPPRVVVDPNRTVDTYSPPIHTWFICDEAEDTLVYPSEADTDPKWPFRGDAG